MKIFRQLKAATTQQSVKIGNKKFSRLTGGHGEYIGEITAVKERSKLLEMTVAMIEEFLDVP